MSYRKAKKLTPPEAAYLAGLIDGEGTITLSRRNRTTKRELFIQRFFGIRSATGTT